VPFGESGEHLVDALLVSSVLAVTGLGELVGVAGSFDAIADVGIGVVTQPVRRLHDVCVGVVDDPIGDVGHTNMLVGPRPTTPIVRVSR
jgi:hypothetical protein